ncbi:MAG: hypothetical protein ACREMX_15210 [Gemmatimonadales bacterium]
MSPAGRGAALRFRGTPTSLSAVIRDWEAPRRLPVHLSQAAGPGFEALETIVARAASAEGRVEMRMSLPRQTPPGIYEGVVVTESGERPVTVEVEPDVELEMVPGQLTLAGSPGERVNTGLTITNLGNVTVEIRHGYQFGVFAIGGMERAIGRTFAESSNEKAGSDRLFDNLAAEHGGLVRVEIEDGGGDLEPGETRDLTVAFRIPDAVDPERTYTGTWSLHDLRYYVRLVPSAEGKPRSPERRRKEAR